jgi:hypothetical protein
MYEIFAALLGLAVFVIAGYGLWCLSKQGPSKPPE